MSATSVADDPPIPRSFMPGPDRVPLPPKCPRLAAFRSRPHSPFLSVEEGFRRDHGLECGDTVPQADASKLREDWLYR
jgi:hypothetical protein